MSVAAPQPPPYAGYREHVVTTTHQTVRFGQEQSFNRTSNAAARRSLDDGFLGRSGLDNRNQSAAALNASSDLLDNVMVDAGHTKSAPAVGSATGNTDGTKSNYDDLTAMFDEAKRGIIEAFDNAQLSIL